MNETIQNAQNEAPEAGCRETKLGSVKIGENFDAEPPFTEISYRIPMRIQTYRVNKKLEDYEEILASTLQLKIQLFFELTEFLGSLLYQGDYDPEKIGEYVNVLGEVGKGLSLTLDGATSQFKRHTIKQTGAETEDQSLPPDEAENPPDEPEPPKEMTMADPEFYQQLADRLTLLLDSGKLPMEIRDSLYHIINTAITESNINADNDYYVRRQFPKAMAALKTDYARGLYHSLVSILDHGVDEELYDSVIKQTREREP